ncbi:MAG: methyltransferase domain-containing protein [Opitutaceae bacterium]|jgi:trans-aconitate methyltransferase
MEDRWDGRKYKENSDPQERFALMGLEKLALRGNERVLDVGCGDGRVTAEIARRVPTGFVLGIDASPSMIAVCTEAHRIVANLSFCVADATSFQVEEPFDAAVSFSALHWVADLRAAVRCIRDALRPGGALVLGMGEGQQKEIAEVFTRQRWRGQILQKTRTFHGRTLDELSAILAECGFADIRVDVVKGARPYADEMALLDWIMTWLPHASGLMGDLALEFGREIVENVRASQPPGAKELVLRSSMLAAKATRI